MIPEPELLKVATRAYVERSKVPGKKVNQQKRKARRQRKTTKPQISLVFDTETTIDVTQKLNFGSCRVYIDRASGLPGTTCTTEYLFYADELPERDPDGFQVLIDYVNDHQALVALGRAQEIHLVSRAEFVEKVLYRYGYRQEAMIVGFNLPFDLSRLAVDATRARKFLRGGNSLKLWHDNQFRPRIAYKTIDAKRALIQFTEPNEGRKFRGRFLDLKTLCFALTDQGFTLERACDAFSVPYQKRDVVHGSITPEYIDYCREDVGATANLYSSAIAEFSRHDINLDVTKALSPASLGKAYLSTMGIRSPLDRQPDFDRDLLGASMTAYFGGRAETRIRKVPMPVVYVDFLSMYPTVNALINIWDLVIASSIEIDDATSDVQGLLSRPNLADQFFNKDLWPQLRCVVEIEPHGDIVPVRAAYDHATNTYGIGINPYVHAGKAWYALPDLVASIVLGGPVPKVVQAKRLRAVGVQDGLTPLVLRGTDRIDPTEDDFFVRVIEQRRAVRADTSLSDAEREQRQQFLKVFANATSYGIMAEFTRKDEVAPIPVDVYVGDDGSFTNKTEHPEDAGPFCFPPIAALITSGAKLMLALLEHQVTKAGGAYVFCDTDSFAIVSTKDGGPIPCPTDGGDTVTALSWGTVDEIVDRFSALNPYDQTIVPGSVLEIERENFDTDGNRHELWCWSISAKRYVLFTKDTDGRPQLVKVSEHGLGHLLNPKDPEDGTTHWIGELWQFILEDEFGFEPEEPAWLDRCALTRVSATGPGVLKWFKGFNADKDFIDQIKPANFLLLAHRDPLDPNPALPIAPYEPDASRWSVMDWIDRRTGLSVKITTRPFDGQPLTDEVRVRTYRDLLADFLKHPESKSLAPDDGRVVGATRGLLQRRLVTSLPQIARIGKEANKLEERMHGLVVDGDDYVAEYVDPEAWRQQLDDLVATSGVGAVAKGLGVDRGTVGRWVSGKASPRYEHLRRIRALDAGDSI